MIPQTMSCSNFLSLRRHPFHIINPYPRDWQFFSIESKCGIIDVTDLTEFSVLSFTVSSSTDHCSWSLLSTIRCYYYISTWHCHFLLKLIMLSNVSISVSSRYLHQIILEVLANRFLNHQTVDLILGLVQDAPIALFCCRRKTPNLGTW